MKAYVINQEQLSRYITLAVAALIISFILGYFAGSSTSESQEKASDEAVAQLPVDTQEAEKKTKVDAPASDNGKQISDAKSEVKKPEIKKQNIKKTEAKKTDIKKTVKTTSSSKPIASSPSKEKDSPKQNTVEQKPPTKEKPAIVEKKAPASTVTKSVVVETKPESIADTTSKQVQAVADSSKQNDDVVLSEPDNSASANRQYSIQAGMFASKTNALSFIEKLTEQNFEAYVTDFVSSSGAVKYNVRVGRFAERETAREKLKEFQKSFSTPAYVVIAQ